MTLYYHTSLMVVAGPGLILVCDENTLLLALEGARQHRVSRPMQRERHLPHHPNQCLGLNAREIVMPPCLARRCVPRRSECRARALPIRQPLM